MPKRTKKDKKKTDVRRQQLIHTYDVEHVHTAVKTGIEATKTSQPTDIKRPQQPTKPHTTYTPTEYEQTVETYTRQDLRKTIVVALALFALEFLVFYAKLNNII